MWDYFNKNTRPESLPSFLLLWIHTLQYVLSLRRSSRKAFHAHVAGITVASGRNQSTLSWRLPLAFQIIPAAILAFGSWTLPEVSLAHDTESFLDKRF
jgi:hypothetical protein